MQQPNDVSNMLIGLLILKRPIRQQLVPFVARDFGTRIPGLFFSLRKLLFRQNRSLALSCPDRFAGLLCSSALQYQINTVNNIFVIILPYLINFWNFILYSIS